MIAVQLVLLKAIVKARCDHAVSPSFVGGHGPTPRRRAHHVFVHSFWEWNRFAYYLQTLGLFWSLLCVSTVYFLFIEAPDNVVFFEVVGSLSLSIEATLAVPQLYRSYMVRECGYMYASYSHVWMCGVSRRRAQKASQFSW
jgi:hypothetical protein